MQHLNNKSMEIEHIRSVLTTTNLNPQPSTYDKILDFLENDMGIQNKGTDYQVLAAFAIISEVQKIKTVDNSQEVSTGIHLQAVMKHLGKHSKEMLLNQAIRQCQKWRDAPSWLKAKIDSVNIAYRIYKKYRTLFHFLSKNHSHLDEQNQFQIMSIFWVVYLLIKNSTVDTDSLEATKILQALVKYVFSQVLAQLDQTQIHRHFKEYFKIDQPLQYQVYQTYKKQIESKLIQIQLEYRGKDLNLIELVNNELIAQRFLDDMGNYYQKFKATLPPNYVDQLSFIQLEKSLPPLPLFRSFNEIFVINEMLNLQEDEDDSKNEENERKGKQTEKPLEKKIVLDPQYSMRTIQPIELNRQFCPNKRIQPVSPFRKISSRLTLFEGTPVSVRNQNLAWVNKITQLNERQNLEQIKNLYQLYSGNNYENYQKQAHQKILLAIDHFTPICNDYAKRQHSIYSFFAYFVKVIYNKHQQQDRRNMFRNDIYFNAVLCLSTNLFNYASQSLPSPYNPYCEIFEIGIVQSLAPIKQIGNQLQMPKNITVYLYDIQKRILIQQIWDQGVGYGLITQNSNNYQRQSFLKRVKKHAEERTQQLCQVMKIETKQIGKVVNLIAFILQKRQSLLKEHNIDQLIVCGITSIVSINRSQNISLTETFENYNKLLFSSNISRSIFYDREGQPIDILAYYNHVFLPQVDEIICNQEENVNILNTPIRLDIKNRLERGAELPLATLKFKQFSIGNLGKKKVKTESEEKYRNKIISNVLNMDINEKDEKDDQQLDEDMSIHNVKGRVSKTMSFGGISNNQKF